MVAIAGGGAIAITNARARGDHLASELLNLKPERAPAGLQKSPILALQPARWGWSCIKSGKTCHEVANFPRFNTCKAF